MKHQTKNEKQTYNIAKQFIKELAGGGVYGLVGELGAGKTAFVKGAAQALGITKRITSPTFVVMRVYDAKHKTIKRLVHVDAYRLKKAASLAAIGLEDFINDAKTLVLIEWADLVSKLLPNKKNIIKIVHQPTGREISLPSSLRVQSKSKKVRRPQSTNQRYSKY